MNRHASGKGPSSKRVTLLVPNGSITRINNNCLHCSFPGSSTAVVANIPFVTHQLCAGQQPLCVGSVLHGHCAVREGWGLRAGCRLGCARGLLVGWECLCFLSSALFFWN